MRWTRRLKKQEERGRRQSAAAPRGVRNDQGAETHKSGTSKFNSHSSQSNAYSEDGELSQGGQHGVEKRLPEPNTLSGVSSEPRTCENADRDIIGPIPSQPLANDEGDASSFSTDSSEANIAQALAEDTGHGLAESGGALAKMPMDLSLAIAQGFHNAPRLYGDATVRTTTRISGFHSGLRAAGEEFAFGIYDGVTGLVLQPYNGAKQGGILGCLSGVGKGFGGFILKPLGAMVAPVAYTFKGLHKELHKGKQPTAFVRRARIAQGRNEFMNQDGKTLAAYAEKIEAACKIVCEIREETERKGKEGLIGRIRVKRERREMARQGAFKGSVWGAKKVVEERKMSRFVEEDRVLNAEVEGKAREQYNGGKKWRQGKRTIRFKREKRNG